MQMLAEAERYCDLIEQAEFFEPDVFTLRAAIALAELIRAALELPDVALVSDDLLPDFLEEDEIGDRDGAVRVALGDWPGYFDAQFPPAMDLAEIWWDIKPGLIALERGYPADDVTWTWREKFYSHWGNHAAEALHDLIAALGGVPGVNALGLRRAFKLRLQVRGLLWRARLRDLLRRG